MDLDLIISKLTTIKYEKRINGEINVQVMIKSKDQFKKSPASTRLKTTADPGDYFEVFVWLPVSMWSPDFNWLEWFLIYYYIYFTDQINIYECSQNILNCTTKEGSGVQTCHKMGKRWKLTFTSFLFTLYRLIFTLYKLVFTLCL